MPFDVLTVPDNFRIQGSLTVIQDPGGNSGNVNIQGTLVTSGTASFASGLTASSISAGGLNSSFTGGLTATGGLIYDFVSGSQNAGLSTTASSQSVSTSGALITMTSGLSAGTPHVIYVSAASTSATCTFTPTSSASTSGIFQNGVEITVVNLGVSGSRVVIPVSGAGSYNTDTIVISGGHAARFVYNAALQTWLPLIS